MEYECTCGKTFEAEHINLEDDYFDQHDGEQYIVVWLETCPYCGREYMITEYYRRIDAKIEEVEE